MSLWRCTLTMRDHLGDTLLIVMGEGSSRENAIADAIDSMRSLPDHRRHMDRYYAPIEGDSTTVTTTLVRA